MALAGFNLDGRVALITGGGTGLGKAMASALTEAGADIIIASRNMERLEGAAEELKASGRRVLPLQVDITDGASVRTMVEEALGRMGRVDILVNNSGISGEKRFVEMDEEDWDRVLHTNLRGAFLVSRALAGDMIGRGWGRIINVASVLAAVGMPTLTAYCSSKGGIIQFTRALALELVRYGITVNALCPGYFLTDLNKDFFTSEQGQEFIKRHIPMRRIGKPEELSGAIVFLASETSAFMTGAAIYIDGGQSAS